MAIAWTAALDTGIDVIDQQHRRIVDYINQLEQAIDGEDPHGVAGILDDLVDYTLSHFAFEESLQDQVGYRFSKPHKAVHDIFTKRIEQFQARQRAGEPIAPQLHAMLTTWLVHHIQRDDMAYVAEVRASIDHVLHERHEDGWLSRSIARFFGPR